MIYKFIPIVFFAAFAGALCAGDLQGVEPRLIGAMDKIHHERIDDALLEIKDLLRTTPQFDLAQLVYADLLMAKAGLPARMGLTPANNPDNKLDKLRDEARVRWLRYQDKHAATHLPAALLRLSAEQKTVIVVDLSRSRLYLFENSDTGPRLLADFYVTQGKNGEGKNIEGDNKTPLGTYFVTGSLDVEKLPDLYGTGAFPIDYPNAWDRRLGYTGHGIWLHGVPSNTYSRVPLDTRGCLAMSNPELDSIKPFLHAGTTPVIIASEMQWVSPEQLKADTDEINQQLDKWLQDWQSRDVEAYLKHYSSSFQSDNKNFATWSVHKKRVNKYKKFIDVRLSQLSILRYSGQADMLTVSYKQDYRSSNFNGSAKKRQYWKKESDGQWRIIYEGRG